MSERGEFMGAKVSFDGNTEQLTPKQEQLITLLCSGINIVTAAKNAGISEKTAHKWLHLKHFEDAYHAAQRSLFDSKLDVLRAGVSTALLTLNRNMTDKDNVPPSVQVTAARIWLDAAIQIHKMNELEQQVKELQELIKGRTV